MNIQMKMPTTADEFLRWNTDREGKREFVRGRVVELMVDVTRNHVRMASRMLLALARRLNPVLFDTGSADFGVATADGIRYPDVFVDRRTSGSHGTDLVTSAPVLLAEILSASSRERDFVEKLADYTSLPTLLHYLVFSPEEPQIWLWSRDDAGHWNGPLELAGLDQTLELSSLEMTVPLSELHAGIER